jgi:hypothetical protein
MYCAGIYTRFGKDCHTRATQICNGYTYAQKEETKESKTMALINWIQQLWCKWFHGPPMHPIHSKYVCRKCLRVTNVDWKVVYSSGKE